MLAQWNTMHITEAKPGIIAQCFFAYLFYIASSCKIIIMCLCLSNFQLFNAWSFEQLYLHAVRIPFSGGDGLNPGGTSGSGGIGQWRGGTCRIYLWNASCVKNQVVMAHKSWTDLLVICLYWSMLSYCTPRS